MTDTPDSQGSPNGAARTSPWWRRALARIGVLSVWSAGLAVFVVALAMLGVVWLSRQPAGHQITFALANRALTQSTNLRLSARRSLLIEQGAYLVGPAVDLVDSTGVRYPFLVASGARVVTSWWGLLTRNPGDIRVVLKDPVITLTRRRDGTILWPAFRPGPRSTREPITLAVDLGLENALVRVVGGGAPRDTIVRAMDLTGRAHGSGSTWDFALGRFAAEFPGARLKVTKADGRLRMSEGELALQHLRVRTDAGWIEGSAAGTYRPGLDVEGRVRAGEWTWHDLAGILRQPALDLSGGVAGEAHLHVMPGRIALSNGSADVLWRDEPARARFDALLEPHRLSVSHARVDWRRAAFTGAFTYEPEARRWRLAGTLDGLDLAELPRLWPMPALEPVRIGGDFELAGTPRGLDGRVARARGSWGEVAFDSLGGTWSLAGKTQTVDARLRAAGAAVAAKGTLGAHDLDGSVRLTDVDATRVPPAWWKKLGLSAAPDGRVESLDAKLAGPYAAPSVQGTAVVRGVREGGLDVSRATLAFDGRLGRDYAVTTSLAASESRAGFAAADTADAVVSVTPQRIDLTSFRAERAESTLVLSGSATRNADGWDARIDHLAWDGGERIQLNGDGALDFRLEPDGAVTIQKARVVSTAGALSAKGRWGGSRGVSDLSLDLETLDLESLLGPMAASYDVRGVLTGHARLEGDPKHPVWTVDLDASDLHYKGHSAQRLAARGRFAQEAWRVEEFELNTGQGRVTFEGELAWDQPPPWPGSVDDWNRALRGSPRWSGTLVTDHLALGQISEFYGQAGGWRGELSTTFLLSGRPSAPIVTARGTLAKPGWGQAALDDFKLDLDYRDDLLTIRRFAMVGPDSAGPSFQGTLPIRLGWGVPADQRLTDRPMSITGHARGLSLGLVPLILPQIAAASGHGDFDVQVTGTPKAPYARGTITIRDGIVRPANREEVLTGVTGVVQLDGSELKIASFEARQGKRGRVTVTPGGTAHFKDLRITDYRFAVEARNLTAFASGEYVIELDGSFQVTNGPDLGGVVPLPNITGRASVIEGVFLANFADPGRQAAWQGPAVLPPWTYDIMVEGDRNVWWRPIDANVEGRLTDFEVIQSLNRFVMTGQVDAIRGRYYFLGSAFDIKTGQLFFDLTEPMNPTINAVLTTEQRLPMTRGGARELITITATGRAQSPTVTMTSEPSGLSQSEIAQLLTYGQLEGGAASAIGQAGVNYLARQLAREVPELEKYFGVVTVGTTVDQELGTAPGSTTTASRAYTSVGVSRYFTRDLLLRYSQVVGDVTEAQKVDYQDLEAEYQISRLFFVTGQMTRQRGTLVQSQDQTFYNMALRARYEY